MLIRPSLSLFLSPGLSDFPFTLQDQENPLNEPLFYPLSRSNSADLVDLSADEEEDLGAQKSEAQAGRHQTDLSGAGAGGGKP